MNNPDKLSVSFAWPSVKHAVTVSLSAFASGLLGFLAANQFSTTITTRALVIGAIGAGLGGVTNAWHLYQLKPGTFDPLE